MDYKDKSRVTTPVGQSQVTLETTTGMIVSVERWNELQDELLTWRTRTLAALQTIYGLSGQYGSLDEIQAIIDRGEQHTLRPGIPIAISESDKAWLVPLAHAEHLSLGNFIRQKWAEKQAVLASPPPIAQPLCTMCQHPMDKHEPKGYGGCSVQITDGMGNVDYCPCNSAGTSVRPAAQPSQVSAEQFLAHEGFADSRAHSATAIAQLMERWRAALAATPPQPEGRLCDMCSQPIDEQIAFLNRELANFRRNAQYAWQQGMEEALKIFGDSITWSEASRAIPARIKERAEAYASSSRAAKPEGEYSKK